MPKAGYCIKRILHIQNSLEDVSLIVTVKALSNTSIFLAGSAHRGVDLIYNALCTGHSNSVIVISETL